MKTEDARWSRLRDLFSRAMDLPADQRDAFVAKECRDDRELGTELRDLLAADMEQLGGPLTSAVDGAIRATSQDRRHKLLGNVVGSYRLVSVLGHGGAGTVYLAERADRQYSAQVAVKIVESALLHADIGHRFRAERQILASLNHPNIARLIDAGETPGGQPYLVMEYVHGVPIDRYCDSKQLSIEKRLELFLKVCAAVQYAHQNLIVHRDLKPANILVTPDGTPKLLDFGIAKLLDTNAAAAALALTRVNDRILTPEYASPEQILGQAVTTTSDVYALGIVLFELLTGARPYEVSAVSQLELERSICVTDPHRPSTMIARLEHGHGNREAALEALAKDRSTAPKRLVKQLSGDLDAIVMRALRKEPGKRYGSIEQLADDVRRHLDKQPVQARQGNWLYYSQRFVGRHVFGVSVTIATALLLIAFSVMTSIQSKRIAAERDRATQERQRAETVSNFMLDVFAASDPFVSQGKETTARELLDQAGQRIANDLTQQPQVRARLLEAIGRAYQRQGLPDLAVPFLKDALQIERKFGPVDSIELADTLSFLGIALRDKGNFGESAVSFSESKQILGQLHQQKTERYAQLLADVGRLEHLQSNLDSAQKYYDDALALTKEIHGSNHREVAVILMELVTVFQWKGDWASAERAAREMTAIYRATTPELHPDRVKGDYVLGGVLLKSGKLTEAGNLVERVLEFQKKIYGAETHSVAATLDTLSSIRIAEGKLAEAERLERDALVAIEKSQGKAYYYTGYYRTALASLLNKRRNFREAEKEAREAFKSLSNILSEDHQYVASAEYVLGEALLGSNNSKEAETTFIANIARWQRSGAQAWRAARSENALGVVQASMNRPQEAERHLVASYKIIADPKSGASDDAVKLAKERLENFYTARGEADKLAAVLASVTAPRH